MTDEQAFWLQKAREASEVSPDPSRKTGCVVVLESKAWIVAQNNFPSGVEVTASRLERPAKYAFMEHAERNAIGYAARHGMKLKGSTVYLTWFPCAECARMLAVVGAKELVCSEPDWSEERYGFRDAETILKEAGVKIIYVQS